MTICTNNKAHRAVNKMTAAIRLVENVLKYLITEFAK
jgi:hypothetical protein